ncbi:hypothetical protein PHLCEN_2v11071 [Hermanssonia centrifuga]|uniref:Uncharacterized protein n=1 Tax=Hermanssonia centrifuga TaxID=98765 RepID=A0A2R6NKY6_9APHY|nr:hypothetical protein PHLCEN_2v11071 [Hermanssonia centrifuga]
MKECSKGLKIWPCITVFMTTGTKLSDRTRANNTRLWFHRAYTRNAEKTSKSSRMKIKIEA